MLLYSTMLKIKDSMTKEAFINLVIQWNQNSPHEENIITPLNWRGEMNIRFGTETMWLDIQEYRNKNIVAIRYEKDEGDGVVWDTDFVMNFDEMQMAIRLERNFRNDAANMELNYSTPYFLVLLIEGGYLEDDAGIPILRRPIYVNKKNIGLLADVINEKNSHSLPVIYVSKTINEREPVNVNKLAGRLKGAAHVMVEDTRELNYPLRELCDDKNNYDGAIGIYYSNPAMGNFRYMPARSERGRWLLLEKIARRIINIAGSQYIDSLYTWDGVMTALAMDRFVTQKNKRMIAETETAQVWDTFDDDFRKLEKRIDELTKENERLRAENQGLMMKISDRDSIPIILQGQEEDFFPGEIKDIVLSIFDNVVRTLPEGSRRKDVVADILEANDYQRLLESRQEEIKRILTGYKKVSSAQKNALKALGFSISEEGKHYKLRYFGDSRYQTTMAKTGSENRGGANLAAEIIRNML